MTESQWLKSVNTSLMLDHLEGVRASDRKLRLFAVACCRRIWRLLTNERSRHMVGVIERYADRLGSHEELADAFEHATADEVCDRAPFGDPLVSDLAFGGINAAREVAHNTAKRLADWMEFEGDGALSGRADWETYLWAERKAQCRLLREIFGPLPFRPVVIDPSWLAWNGGTVPKLARVTYDERAYDQLPILADALEEAGCTNAEVLAHCRGPGPHVRGCWVLDLLLGKK